MPGHVPRYSRREALGLGVAAIGAALFAACRGDDDDAIEGTSTAEAPAGVSLLAAPQPPPSGEGGILRLGVVGEAELPLSLKYARLLAIDPRSVELHGDLAIRVEQRGPLEIAVELRRDAYFHPDPQDGLSTPVDAKAVLHDFIVRADAGEFLFNKAVAAVENPEPYLLLLRLRAPFALLFEYLSDTDAAAIRAQRPSSLGLPLGGGPFIPERREDGGFSLLPHPLYHHAGLPILDEVRIIAAQRGAALDAAFETRALDLRTLDETSDIERVAQRADAVTMTRSTRQIRGLGLSLVGTKGGSAVRFVEAFQDDRVRRAIFRSIDHAELADLEDGPTPAPVGPVGPSFAADALPEDELASHPLFRRDLDDAHKLLDAAGASGLEFLLDAPSRAGLTALSRALISHLHEGGFQPQLSVVSAEEWQRALAAGDFEATLIELNPVRTPDVGLRLHTSDGLDGAFSPWGYSNPVYDEAVRDALSAIVPAERAELARDAQRTLLEDAPALVPLPERVEQLAISTHVGGYEYEVHEFNEEWLAARWHLLRETEGS